MKITEEFLKAKGWEISHYDLPAELGIFKYATKMFGKDKVHWNDTHQLTIFRDYSEDSDTYADVLIDNVDTVEKLQEALVFCGVTEKPEKPTNLTWEDEFINKAVNWISANACKYVKMNKEVIWTSADLNDDFRKFLTEILTNKKYGNTE